MYVDLYNVIAERLVALGMTNVGTALGDDQPLPSVQPFLHEDREIDAKPMAIRALTWAVRVTVGHNETAGAAQAEILVLLDTIRDGFAGWRPPDCVGIQAGFIVPSVKIQDFQDHGSTVYVVLLGIRVIPETFNRT